METKTRLEPETIRGLQELIQINMDASRGFDEVAHQIKGVPLAQLFQRLGEERAGLAIELKEFVSWNGQQPVEEGSVAARIHQLWIDLRGKLNPDDPYPLLIEAERGEDHIKAAYETVIRETVGSALNDVLLAQYERVKAGHDLVRDLRDTFAANR